MRSPRLLALTLVAALAATPVGAQVFERTSLITAPHFTQYTMGSGADERTISQMAIPFVVVMPFGSRFAMDITTAFANSQLKANGSTQSTISGLTDTQIRGNYTFGNQMVVLTMGINIPTGQYSVAAEDADAAGQIGNDFLNYPISSMGNGLAGTGGIAFAVPMGTWNVGLGASMRKSTEFAAFTLTSDEFRFTPADEYRLRVGADRPVGDGELSFGLAYSAFGADAMDTTSGTTPPTTASTGDRIIANGMWMTPLANGELYLSAWNLFRLAGEQFGGESPAQNVANLSAAYSVELGPVLVQPSLEGRFWQMDGARAGQLTNLNVRLRLGTGMLTAFPSVGYSLGKLYDPVSGAATDVTGMRGSLTIRFN